MYQVKEELRYTRLCQKEECLERPFSEATNKTFILVQKIQMVLLVMFVNLMDSLLLMMMIICNQNDVTKIRK